MCNVLRLIMHLAAHECFGHVCCDIDYEQLHSSGRNSYKRGRAEIQTVKSGRSRSVFEYKCKFLPSSCFPISPDSGRSQCGPEIHAFGCLNVHSRCRDYMSIRTNSHAHPIHTLHRPVRLRIIPYLWPLVGSVCHSWTEIL